MKFSVILPLLPLLAVASPTCKPSSPGDSLTAAQIEAVAPKSSSCANPDEVAPEECATAAQAAPALTTAFKKYGVTSKAEQAAVLGLIAMESGEFRFSRNHFPSPGVEGKGSMLPFSFIFLSFFLYFFLFLLFVWWDANGTELCSTKHAIS